MGLQLWLPLNGDVKNYGLCNAELSYSNLVFEDSGKIGKCLSTGGIVMSADTTGKILNNNAITISLWLYVNAPTGSDGERIFGNNEMGYNNNRKFSLYQYPTCNDFHYSWMNDTPDVLDAGLLTNVLPSYQWTHIAVTYDNPNICVYINGELKHTSSGVSNSASFHYTTNVIYDSLYHKVNDFRLYDSALSAREIREIYNNPIVHFPMNNVYELGITNKYSGDFAEGYLYDNDRITRTKLPDERGYNYKLSYTGSGYDYWEQINIGNSFSFTAGKTYYYSCKVRCHSKSNTGLYFRAARSDNDWVTNNVNVLNDDGRWHEYVISQTINETYDRSDSTITCHPYVEFYTNDMYENGTTYTFDVDIKDIQVTEDRHYPFIANELVDSTISDTSGYCNNGMVEGGTSPQSVGQLVSQSSITLPRYSSQYYFSGKDYIKFQNPFYGQQLSQLTINFYVNISEGCGNYATIFSIYGGGTDNRCPWIAVNCEGAGLWGYIPESNSYLYNSGGYLEYNTWHMATFVFKDGKAQWYLDGQKNIEPTAFSAGLITFTDVPTLSIGNSYRGTSWTTDFVGYLSDFRMYANALTETDIKRLYNTSASLDSQGNLMLSGEVIE